MSNLPCDMMWYGVTQDVDEGMTFMDWTFKYTGEAGGQTIREAWGHGQGRPKGNCCIHA